MKDSASKVSIVGAGLTGLTAAFYLKRAGIPFVVFEKTAHIGGAIRSSARDGFLWEHGPNTGVVGKPEVAELFEDLGGNILQPALPSAKNRFIWKGKKWHKLPGGPVSGLFTPLFSLRDKLGILLEPWRPKGTDPNETLETFVKRRLGQSSLDYAVDPFVAGVYSGLPSQIIPRCALPKLYNLEANYGSFIRGSIAKMKEPKTDRDQKATKQIFSAKGGLETLIKKLTEQIGEENIKVNSTPDLSDAETVIFTAGAEELPRVFPCLSGQGFDDAFRVTYAPVVEVAVGFKHWNGIPIDGFGGLVPSKEKRKVLGVLYMSSIFDDRAPQSEAEGASGALFTVFVGGSRQPELAALGDAQIRELVASEFQALMGVPDFAPDLFDITRVERAIPQYDRLTPARWEAMAAIGRAHPGWQIGGNGIGGIGMADRIVQGRKMAEAVAKVF
jgi:oxygen-dependent protoporphyrinogen oxidase